MRLTPYLGVLAMLVACSGDSDKTRGAGGDGGAGSGNDGLGQDGDGGSGSGPENGRSAAGGPHNRVTPDILIVLDRSGSMEMNGRWDPSVKGVESITAALDSQINFGLMTFPSDDRTVQYTCKAGAIQVPVGAKTAATIKRTLDPM